MFSFIVAGPTDEMAAALDIRRRLDSRRVVPAEEFDETMRLREETHQLKDYVPKSDVSRMFPGTYYLEGVDAKFRRTYGRTGATSVSNGVH